MKDNEAKKIQEVMRGSISKVDDVHQIISNKIDIIYVGSLDAHVPLVKFTLYISTMVLFLVACSCFLLFRPKSYILLNSVTERKLEAYGKFKQKVWFIVLLGFVINLLSDVLYPEIVKLF